MRGLGASIESDLIGNGREKCIADTCRFLPGQASEATWGFLLLIACRHWPAAGHHPSCTSTKAGTAGARSPTHLKPKSDISALERQTVQ